MRLQPCLSFSKWQYYCQSISWKTCIILKLYTIHWMYHKNWWNNNIWCWRFRFSHSICNLTEQSSNCSQTTVSLWFYLKDGRTNFNVNIANDSNFNIFKHKAKFSGNTEAQPSSNNNNNEILKKCNNSCALKVFK